MSARAHEDFCERGTGGSSATLLGLFTIVNKGESVKDLCWFEFARLTSQILTFTLRCEQWSGTSENPLRDLEWLLVISYFKPKMLIPLKKSEDDAVQWTLVEFHGDLKSVPKISHAHNIGYIYFESNGLVMMNIGTHVLEGKVLHLEKPMALIKKIVESPSKTSKETEQKTYTLKAIVRTKLIFLSRAKPLAIKPA